MRCSTRQSTRQQPDLQTDGHRLENEKAKK